MGLLDDYETLLRGRGPKALPPSLAGPLKTPTFNGAPTKGPMDFGVSDLATSPPGADQQKSMSFALDDIAPGTQAPGALTTPGGKIGSQMAQGDPRLPPTPELSSGLLANKPALPAGSPFIQPKPPMPPAFAERAPLRPTPPGPPPRPPELASAPAMPPPRPPGIGNMAGLPQQAPMPPMRPPELDTAAIPSPVPIADTPIIGMGGGTTADVGSSIGGATGGAATAGMGGGDILGGILGAAGGLAKMFGGNKGAAPQAKAPTFSPSNAGPTVDAEIAKDRQQAPQIMAGLLADDVKSLIDPRKRRT